MDEIDSLNCQLSETFFAERDDRGTYVCECFCFALFCFLAGENTIAIIAAGEESSTVYYCFHTSRKNEGNRVFSLW